MKRFIAPIVAGIAATAAFSTAAANTSTADNFSAATEIKHAAPAPNDPSVEPEFELMATDPDVLNRPPR